MERKQYKAVPGPLGNDRDGTGIRLTGLPTDYDAFVALLAEHSCHPKASARIYERIKEKGYDDLTVMYRLPFPEIAAGLKQLGVELTFIRPLKGWQKRFTDY